MTLSINTNVQALTAYKHLAATQASNSTSSERLSSGLRINHASDDAAGLAIANTMGMQLAGISQSQKNAQQALDLANSASNDLGAIVNILNKMQTLAHASASDILQTARDSNVTQFAALNSELDRYKTNSNLNGTKLLDGTAGSNGKIKVQVGASSTDLVTIDLSNAKVGSSDLGTANASLSSTSGALTAEGTITTALNSINTVLANLGAIENTLQDTADSLATESVNLSSSMSTIQDADIATEYANYMRTNALAGIGNSMLKQALTQTQQLQQLVQG